MTITTSLQVSLALTLNYHCLSLRACEQNFFAKLAGFTISFSFKHTRFTASFSLLPCELASRIFASFTTLSLVETRFFHTAKFSCSLWRACEQIFFAKLGSFTISFQFEHALISLQASLCSPANLRAEFFCKFHDSISSGNTLFTLQNSLALSGEFASIIFSQS
jgi:hypothetical protein